MPIQVVIQFTGWEGKMNNYEFSIFDEICLKRRWSITGLPQWFKLLEATRSFWVPGSFQMAEQSVLMITFTLRILKYIIIDGFETESLFFLFLFWYHIVILPSKKEGILYSWLLVFNSSKSEIMDVISLS